MINVPRKYINCVENISDWVPLYLRMGDVTKCHKVFILIAEKHERRHVTLLGTKIKLSSNVKGID